MLEKIETDGERTMAINDAIKKMGSLDQATAIAGAQDLACAMMNYRINKKEKKWPTASA